MKKLFSCVMALLAAACLYATDLNIYASGLKVHQTSTGATIDYMLNAPATSLNVYIYGPANTLTPAKTIDLSTDAANLTKGAHTGVAIDLSGLADAVYTWAIEAEAAAHNDVAEVLPASSDYYFYGPRGVAVDNCPESPYFGRVYVSNAYAGKTATDPNCRDTYQGMYIFDATLAPLFGGNCYNGNVNWTAHGEGAVAGNSDWGPYRVAISDDGYVFICDNGVADDTKTGVYMMDPANPSADFVNVLGHAGANAIFHRANSLDVTGSGDNRVLYLNDWTDSIISYPIGNTFPCTVKGPTVVPALLASHVANAQNSIARDNNGGFWVAQYRGQLDTYPQLTHFNALGVQDCSVSSEENDGLGLTKTNRGAMALNPSNTKVVFGGGGTMQVLSIGEDGEGKPTLATIGAAMPTGLGTSVDGFAFDIADNVYVVSASTELLRIFALPKAENKFKTPAPASEYIALPCVDNLYEIGSNQGWATNAGVAMTKIATNVFEKEFVFSSGSTVYFTFTSNLSVNWNELNLYGATTHDEGISPALSPRNLVSASENSFAIASGRYKITADLNTMEVTVEELVPVVSIAGSDGMGDWSTTANVLVEADDHLTASKTIHLTPNMYNFKVVLNHYIWNTDHNAPANNTQTSPTEMNRANCTGWVFDQGDGYKDTRLRVDLEGDYEFVYTYATKELSISGFPTSFTRTVTAEDAEKYQTLCVPFDATISGATAYEFDGATETGVTLNAVASDALEAGKSYLILPEGAGSIVVSAIPAGDVAGAPEDLHGLSGFYGILGADYEYVFADNDFATYVLQDDNKFHKIIGTASATITSTHAYLHVAGGIQAPALRIIMGATNIENVEDVEQAVKFIQNGQMFIKKNGIVYDMMGNIVR